MPVRYNDGLAEWVNRLVAGHSLRQVEIRTRVPFTTIGAMKQGRTPNADTIIRFASAFGEDVAAALRLAGYDDIAEVWEKGAAPAPAREEPRYERDEWADDPDAPEVMAFYTGLPAGDREVVKALLRALTERAAGDRAE